MSDIYVSSDIDDAGLDLYEFRIVGRIARRGELTEAIPKLAERLGISHNTVRDVLKTLVAGGAVACRRRPGKTSVYTLRPVSEWRPDIIKKTRVALRGPSPDSQQTPTTGREGSAPETPTTGREGEADTPTTGREDTPTTRREGHPYHQEGDEGTPFEGTPNKDVVGADARACESERELVLSGKDARILEGELPRLRDVWQNTRGSDATRLEAVCRACWGRRPNAAQRRELGRLMSRWPTAAVVQGLALAAAAGREIDSVDAFIENRQDHGENRSDHSRMDQGSGHGQLLPQRGGAGGRARIHNIGKKRDGALSRREWLIKSGWSEDQIDRLAAGGRR